MAVLLSPKPLFPTRGFRGFYAYFSFGLNLSFLYDIWPLCALFICYKLTRGWCFLFPGVVPESRSRCAGIATKSVWSRTLVSCRESIFISSPSVHWHFSFFSDLSNLEDDTSNSRLPSPKRQCLEDTTRMTTLDSDLPDRYNLVSSLYGPGTTACWYLTVLSCLVSWTLHPKKRKSGSLDSDFIAVLTFPAVAAGHLISQIHHYPDDKAELLTTNDPDLFLRIAAIEAPLNITETSMPTLVLMFILALYFRCIKRAIYTALVGMFCAAAESYMFFVTWSVGNSQQNLSRPFLINFA